MLVIVIKLPILLSSTIFLEARISFCVPRRTKPNFLATPLGVRRISALVAHCMLTYNYAIFWVVIPRVLSAASCSSSFIRRILNVMAENMSKGMMSWRKSNLPSNNVFTCDPRYLPTAVGGSMSIFDEINDHLSATFWIGPDILKSAAHTASRSRSLGCQNTEGHAPGSTRRKPKDTRISSQCFSHRPTESG